jgi:hypothetical protein
MANLKEQLQKITAIAIEEETNRRAENLIRFWDGALTNALTEAAQQGKNYYNLVIKSGWGFNIEFLIARLKMEGFEVRATAGGNSLHIVW